MKTYLVYPKYNSRAVWSVRYLDLKGLKHLFGKKLNTKLLAQNGTTLVKLSEDTSYYVENQKNLIKFAR